MSKILLPIKPKYSRALLQAIKTFETRRKVPKRKVNEILIYETKPRKINSTLYIGNF